MRLPSGWVTHQGVDETGAVAAASGPAAALAFVAAIEKHITSDRPISDRASGPGCDTERYLKGFIRDMVRILAWDLPLLS